MKTEGKLPYFVLSIIPLLFVLFMAVENAAQHLAWGIAFGVLMALVMTGILRIRKEDRVLISLKSGAIFAVIRRPWVDADEEKAFLEGLKSAIEGARGESSAS